jgi:hypothetical protein
MFLLPSGSIAVKRVGREGRGVIACRHIEAGTVIGDYLGVAMRPQPVKWKDAEPFYLMLRNDRSAIQPDPERPGVHLVNHSCEPNLGIRPYHGHVLFIATRRVFPGEQLTVDYWLYPPPSVLGKRRRRGGEWAPDRCACGSPGCRAVIEIPARKVPEIERFWRRTGGKRMEEPLVPNGREIPPLRRYPDALADEPIYDLFGSRARRAIEHADRRLPDRDEIRRRIRSTGCRLAFPRIGLTAVGVRGREVLIVTHR